MQTRNSGVMTASSPVILVQDTENRHFPFLVLVPIYHGFTNNISERQEKLLKEIVSYYKTQCTNEFFSSVVSTLHEVWRKRS
jgi:CHASE1-domain containing sensor protein